jgi:hypothetical protein
MGNFLTGWATVSFRGRFLFHGGGCSSLLIVALKSTLIHVNSRKSLYFFLMKPGFILERLWSVRLYIVNTSATCSHGDQQSATITDAWHFKTCHSRFLPHNLKFITVKSFYHSALHISLYRNIVFKFAVTNINHLWNCIFCVKLLT